MEKPRHLDELAEPANSVAWKLYPLKVAKQPSCSSDLKEYARTCIYITMQLDAFQTLADPTRRRIVESLCRGERPVGEIVKQSGVHQSGVSRHLRILSDAGFVAMRPDGQRRLYSLKPDRFRELERWLAMYRSLWEARLDRFGVALEKKQKRNRTSSKESS